MKFEINWINFKVDPIDPIDTNVRIDQKYHITVITLKICTRFWGNAIRLTLTMSSRILDGEAYDHRNVHFN